LSVACSPAPVVLFDLDGTLIDSEPIWGAANASLVRSRRAEITEALLGNLSGLDSTLAMQYIHEYYGWVDYDIDGDVAFVQQQVHQAYTRGVHWLPGARGILAAVRAAGFRTGLVTSTYRELVDIVLAEVSAETFDVVVCGDDGHAPKPDPAPYLGAMAELGVPAASCVAVEDSGRGVASARAAGCLVLNVTSSTRSDLAHAWARSLAEVDVDNFRRFLEAAPVRV